MVKQLIPFRLAIMLAILLFFLNGNRAQAQQNSENALAPAATEQEGEIPPPPGGNRHRRNPPHGERLPPPIRHYFMKLQKEDPEEYERLIKLRMENREEFMKELSERLPRQHNPAEEKFRELDRQCWALAEQLRATPPPENAEELQAQLNALVAESVDSMIALTKERLEEIQNHLKQMESLRDQIVEQRLEFYLQAPLYQPQMGGKPPRKGPPPPPPPEEE